MTIAGQQLEAEGRSEPRQAVLYRTRLTDANGIDQPATLVNVSQRGFMARCDGDHATGDDVTLMLPSLGRVAAEVRWSLGGRIGCRLREPCGLSDYHALLHALPLCGSSPRP